MSNFPNRRWLVIPATEVENVDFNQVLESGPDSLRYSVDGSETFVKYEVTVIQEDHEVSYVNAESGETVSHTVYAGTYGRPSIYNGTYPEYNHEEILALLSTEAWTTPMEQDNLPS
jgi:hypothetical protein